jgi:cytoskeletal protein CcmA (bactofilin family)
MFGKRKTETAFAAPQPAAPHRQLAVPQPRPPQPAVPPPQPPQPAVPQVQPAVPRGATRNRSCSIISADLIVKGTLFSAGDVQLDGRLEGDIRANGLVVGETAIIVGHVYAEEAIIRGCVEGNISARKTHLHSACHVEGNLLHETLSVEIGAFFEGNSCPSKNPLANATENVATVERKSNAPLQSIVELDRPQANTAPSQPKPAASSIDGEHATRPTTN